MEVLGQEFTEDLFRFAVLRTGNRAVAIELVTRALAEAEARARHWRAQKHRFLWTIGLLCERMDEHFSTAISGVDLSPELTALLNVDRPKLRSSVALQCLRSLKQSEIAQLLRVRPRDLRVAVAKFKERVAVSGLLESELREQVDRIQLTAEELTLLESAPSAVPLRRFGSERALGVAAIVVGIFMLVGWFAWEQWRASEPVQMAGHLGRLLELTRTSGIAGVEEFKGRAGESTDWLFLHGLEGAQIPEVFSGVPVISARVLDLGGRKVAQFHIDSPQGLLMAASLETLGVLGERTSFGRMHWEDWNGAWCVSGPFVFILSVRGEVSALESLLPSVLPPAARIPPPPSADP